MASGRNKKKKLKKKKMVKPQPVKRAPLAPPPTPMNPPDGPADELEKNATTEHPSQAEEAGGADDKES